MGQQFNDFSQYTLGEFPPDWRGLGSDGGYPGGAIGSGVDDETHFKVVDLAAEGVGTGKALKYDSPNGSNGVRAIVWEAISSGSNLEVAYEFYCVSSNSECQGVLRADIVSGTWYQGGPRSGDDLDLNKYVTKSFSNLANNTSQDWINEGNWQRCRFRVNGQSLYVKIWNLGDDEPESWDVQDTDNSISSGKVGIVTFRPEAFYVRSFGVGTNGDPAPTGPVSGGGEEKTLSETAAGSDSWTAQCQAPVALVSGALASDSLSTIAAVSAGIVSSAQASDQAGDSPAAVGSLQSGATGNDTADALADAAASLTAGAAAGERWTVQAQVLVDLLNQAAASDTIRRAAEDARQAAITEQSQASDQFLSAIQALAELHGAAQVSDVLTAVVAQLASISSGAIASDQFRTSFGFTQNISDGALAADTFGVNFGFRNALQSGALSADVWGLMVNMTAALSEVCTASDLVTALVDTRARVTAGAIATSRFAIVNAGIQYLVMGAITLRTALTSKTGVNPALNHTTNIKPGN